MDVSQGAQSFLEEALVTFEKCGSKVAAPSAEEGFQVGSEDMVVLLGLVGAWRGAVAFRFDPKAVDDTVLAMAGEPVDDPDLTFEAVLEAVNIVAGRGAAKLAEGAGQAVWLTPPLLVRGPSMALKLMNFDGCCFGYGHGDGRGGLYFSAAPLNGGLS